MEVSGKGVKNLSEDWARKAKILRDVIETFDKGYKTALLETLGALLDNNFTVKTDVLPVVPRLLIKDYLGEKDIITLDDLEFIVKRVMDKYGQKWSVSSGASETTETPYSESDKTLTPLTTINSAKSPLTSVNFESSHELTDKKRINPQLTDIEIHTMLIAVKRVLYNVREEEGKSTKIIESVPLRLAVIYLLMNKAPTEEELKRGIIGLIQTYNIQTRSKSWDTVIRTLRNLPGIKPWKDELGIPHYELVDTLRLKILETYTLLKQAEENVQKYSASGEIEDLIKAFMNFFRDYVDESGKHKYLDELARLLVEKNTNSLLVDWYELNSMSPDLAGQALEYPEEILHAAEDAVYGILREDFLKDEPPRIYVRFINLPETLSPKYVQSKYLGKMIQIKGIITAVAEGQRTDGRSGFIEKAVFVCKSCGNEMVRLQRPYEPFVAPAKCDACGSRDIELDLEKSRVIDKREVFVQDSEDAMRRTEMPSYIRVILLDDLARMPLEPGDEVLMTIILRGVRNGNRSNSLAWVGEAVSVIKLTKDAEDIEITPQDEQMFREMADGPDFEEKFIESIAPTVVGHDAKRLKKALAWALFSGDDEVIESMHVRNRIHVLAYGPPATAKTTITKYATELAPRHYWASAPTSSGAGLTAALDTMDGKRVLKAGALVIASGGAAGVNELDKMRDDEYDKLLDAMEEGQFTYNKGGFTTPLTAMTRLFATANPPGGEFNKNKTPIEELYQQFPRPLVSRFDVIVIVREAKELREREAIADAIYRRRRKDVSPIYPAELLTKYIAFAHREVIDVDIPEEVWKVAREYLLKITKNAPTAMPRMIEAFLRLMVARARMHLRDKVTIQDFIAVKDFYTEMLQLLLGTDSEGMMSELLAKFGGVMWTEKEREEVDKIYNIIRYYEEISGEGALLDDIINDAKQAGMDKDETLKLLEEMIEERLISMTKPGRYVTRARMKSHKDEEKEEEKIL